MRSAHTSSWHARISATLRKPAAPRNASQRLATPRHALATRISRTRYAQRPERDSTAGEINESNAIHRRNRARQMYEIANTCTFQSTNGAAKFMPHATGFLCPVLERNKGIQPVALRCTSQRNQRNASQNCTLHINVGFFCGIHISIQN